MEHKLIAAPSDSIQAGPRPTLAVWTGSCFCCSQNGDPVRCPHIIFPGMGGDLGSSEQVLLHRFIFVDFLPIETRTSLYALNEDCKSHCKLLNSSKKTGRCCISPSSLLGGVADPRLLYLPSWVGNQNFPRREADPDLEREGEGRGDPNGGQDTTHEKRREKGERRDKSGRGMAGPTPPKKGNRKANLIPTLESHRDPKKKRLFPSFGGAACPPLIFLLLRQP